MKYHVEKSIQTFHICVDLEPDDYVVMRMKSGKSLCMRYSLATRGVELSLVGEGEVIDKEKPFLIITQRQMEALREDTSAEIAQYINVTIPATYLKEVKKRLEGLPIIV